MYECICAHACICMYENRDDMNIDFIQIQVHLQVLILMDSDTCQWL
jgi:hypothetical protein